MTDQLYDHLIGDAIRINESTNCPNCGAPIESERCPYCGTMFIDFACMDLDKPFYLKIKHNGHIFTVKVKIRNIRMTDEEYTLYCDGKPFMEIPVRDLSMNFDIISRKEINYDSCN